MLLLWCVYKNGVERAQLLTSFLGLQVHLALSKAGYLSQKRSDIRVLHEALTDFVHDPNSSDIAEASR